MGDDNLRLDAQGFMTMEDHVHELLALRSKEYRKLGMDEQGEIVGEIVEKLISSELDARIIILAMSIFGRNSMNEERHNKDGEPLSGVGYATEIID